MYGEILANVFNGIFLCFRIQYHLNLQFLDQQTGAMPFIQRGACPYCIWRNRRFCFTFRKLRSMEWRSMEIFEKAVISILLISTCGYCVMNSIWYCSENRVDHTSLLFWLNICLKIRTHTHTHARANCLCTEMHISSTHDEVFCIIKKEQQNQITLPIGEHFINLLECEKAMVFLWSNEFVVQKMKMPHCLCMHIKTQHQQRALLGEYEYRINILCVKRIYEKGPIWTFLAVFSFVHVVGVFVVFFFCCS